MIISLDCQFYGISGRISGFGGNDPSLLFLMKKNTGSGRKNTMNCWKVILDRRVIDKVFFVSTMKAEEVKRSLVNHDGYDPCIKVVKERKSIT